MSADATRRVPAAGPTPSEESDAGHPLREATGAVADPVRDTHPFGWSQRDWQRIVALAIAGGVLFLFLDRVQSIVPPLLVVILLVGFLDMSMRVVVVSMVAVLFLWLVAPILPPFLIAFFLAALLDPAVRQLEGQGHSRTRAILTLYLFGLLVPVLILVLLVPRVISQVADLSTHFTSYYASIQQSTDQVLLKYAGVLRIVGIHQHTLSGIIHARSGFIQNRVEAALGSLSLFLENLLSRVFWLIIIPIATFFFMRDYPALRARIIYVFPDAHQSRIDRMSREVVDIFSDYIRGLTKICGLYAITAFVLFTALGLRYAVFLALLAGVFYAVPYVGQLITATAAGSVAFLADKHKVLFFFTAGPHSLGYALVVVVCAIVAQSMFDQLVYPRVVGGSVGLYPVVSIFALMAGATLFGVVGMLLAVPVAASVQILLTSFFPKLTETPPAHLLDGARVRPSPQPTGHEDATMSAEAAPE